MTTLQSFSTRPQRIFEISSLLSADSHQVHFQQAITASALSEFKAFCRAFFDSITLETAIFFALDITAEKVALGWKDASCRDLADSKPLHRQTECLSYAMS